MHPKLFPGLRIHHLLDCCLLRRGLGTIGTRSTFGTRGKDRSAHHYDPDAHWPCHFHHRQLFFYHDQRNQVQIPIQPQGGTRPFQQTSAASIGQNRTSMTSRGKDRSAHHYDPDAHWPCHQSTFLLPRPTENKFLYNPKGAPIPTNLCRIYWTKSHVPCPRRRPHPTHFGQPTRQRPQKLPPKMSLDSYRALVRERFINPPDRMYTFSYIFSPQHHAARSPFRAQTLFLHNYYPRFYWTKSTMSQPKK